MKVNTVKEKGWHLMVKLFKKANEDKNISFDEGRILTATDFNINKLLDCLEKAWEDGQLQEIEKKKIIFLIKKIQDDAITLAEYDNIISKEEQDLLDIIKEMILEFYEDKK